MEFIDLQAQLATMRENIDRRIAKVLDHGQFIMGPEVSELEQKLADYVGVKHCISCANGTDALQLSLMALDVGPGDIVFTTAFSFFATAEVIPLVGATPYFVDIDAGTYNISPESLEQAIIEARQSGKGKPRAVIAVDLFGLPADYPTLQTLCDKYDLYLVEDGAQSFGGSIEGRKCGSFGDIATTSFFPAKPLGCYGDGGAIFTQNDEFAELCRSMRVHGKGSHKYENVRIGLNSRLDTIQAAILLEKLQWIEQERQSRLQALKTYQRLLNASFRLQYIPAGYQTAVAAATIRTQKEKRSDLAEYLKSWGVPTQIYYPNALVDSPPFANALATRIDFTRAATEEVLSLPTHAFLKTADIEDIANKANQYLHYANN